MNYPFIYAVMEGNTKVYEGTGVEIAKEFDVHPMSIPHCRINNEKMKGKYDIVKVGVKKELNPKPIKVEPPKQTKEEKELNYLVEHLKEYGNVSFADKHEIKKVDSYLNKLEQLGLKCNARKVYDLDPTIPNPWGKKNNYYYILERVNAKTGSQSI